MTGVETLAKALWEVVPYDRVFTWEDASHSQKEHYRLRALKLLQQFVIYERYKPCEEYL